MPYVLSARSTARDLWVFSQFPGEPDLGPWLLPDGSDVYDLVADGYIDRVGFTPRYVAANRGHRIGDLLWTGSAAKIASRRFVGILTAIEATGYRTFPVHVETRNGESVGDFVGLAVLDADRTKDLYFTYTAQAYSFTASDRVVEALRSTDVTNLSINKTA